MSFESEFCRVYHRLIEYYNSLLEDVYPQPVDPGHYSWAKDVIEKWMTTLPSVRSVLDVGCGQAFVQPLFENFGVQYTGITLGTDYQTAKDIGRNVGFMDYNFLQFDDDSFDLVFSRHSLEHSPFPILTLMEWKRVTRKYLIVVLPFPTDAICTGQNHYSAMSDAQIRFLLERVGFYVIYSDFSQPEEMRYLCMKEVKNENSSGV